MDPVALKCHCEEFIGDLRGFLLIGEGKFVRIVSLLETCKANGYIDSIERSIDTP